MSHVICRLEATLQLFSKLWIDWVSVPCLFIQRPRPKSSTYMGHAVLTEGAGAMRAKWQQGT